MFIDFIPKTIKMQITTNQMIFFIEKSSSQIDNNLSTFLLYCIINKQYHNYINHALPLIFPLCTIFISSSFYLITHPAQEQQQFSLFILIIKSSEMSENKKDYDFMFKLILIGSVSVGKSNILLKYTKDQFSENSQSTIGVQYATKVVTTTNGSRIKFQIWDTAGQEKYRALMKTYYKGSSAALIIYDITREDTFLNLDNEQKLIKEFIKGDIITMIVGNKIDLEEKRTVSKQRGLEYAESKKIAFYEVSAKDGTNINLIFTRIAEQLEKAVNQTNKQENGGNGGQQAGRQMKKPSVVGEKQQEVIVLNTQNEQQRVKANKEQKKKCCA